MANEKTTQGHSGLHLSWVPVRDKRGRVHMEAHWAADTLPAQRSRRPAA